MESRGVARLRRVVARPWLLAFVPINAATSAFGIILPLYILLVLHGHLLDVGFAAALFNGSLVFASLWWGRVSDRYSNRRALLVINFAGFAALYGVIAEVPSVFGLFAAYSALGFLAPAAASASNLLILEQFPEEERGTAFASFQEMSIVGGVAGGLVGFAWLVTGHPLVDLLFVLAGLAALSIPLVFVGRLEVNPTASTLAVAGNRESFASRVRHSAAGHFSVPFFPHRGEAHPASGRRFRRWLREELHHELPLIFGATLLFNLSANLFNTSYTPYLLSVGVVQSSIFLVNFTNNVVQAVAFPLSGPANAREGFGRLVTQATFVRGAGYLAVLSFTFLPLTVAQVYGANVIAYSILGGAIAFYATASSLFLFRALKGRDAPNLLGVNSALGGVAAVSGSFASGVLSQLGGYRLTFVVAAVTLVLSLPLWVAARLAFTRRGGQDPEPPAPGDRPTFSTSPAVTKAD